MDSKLLRMEKPSRCMVSKMVRYFNFLINCLPYLTFIDNTISMTLRLLGGKKKRKKKIYTKPKKIGHKHKKRPKALLTYFQVDSTGKVTKMKIECEKCPAGKLRSSQREIEEF